MQHPRRSGLPKASISPTASAMQRRTAGAATSCTRRQERNTSKKFDDLVASDDHRVGALPFGPDPPGGPKRVSLWGRRRRGSRTSRPHCARRGRRARSVRRSPRSRSPALSRSRVLTERRPAEGRGRPSRPLDPCPACCTADVHLCGCKTLDQKFGPSLPNGANDTGVGFRVLLRRERAAPTSPCSCDTAEPLDSLFQRTMMCPTSSRSPRSH